MPISDKYVLYVTFDARCAVYCIKSAIKKRGTDELEKISQGKNPYYQNIKNDKILSLAQPLPLNGNILRRIQTKTIFHKWIKRMLYLNEYPMFKHVVYNERGRSQNFASYSYQSTEMTFIVYPE